MRHLVKHIAEPRYTKQLAAVAHRMLDLYATAVRACALTLNPEVVPDEGYETEALSGPAAYALALNLGLLQTGIARRCCAHKLCPQVLGSTL